MEQDEIILTGSVESVTYHNETSGFSVIELSTDEEQTTVVGILPFVNVGEQLIVKGSYTTHPSFGPQFKAEYCERKMPATSAAILRYLASGAVKGVGPVTAQLIVDRFGENTLKVMEENPERLTEIKGISPKKAQKIAEEYMRNFGVKEVMLRLSSLNITSDEALRIYKKLGSNCIDMISENPYMLCSEGIGLGFERVDIISNSLENSVPLEYRIKAGIEYVLRHNLHNGHTCLPKHRLAQTSSQLLQADEDTITNIIDTMIENGNLSSRELNSAEFVFLPQLYKAERYCANRIALMLKVPPNEIPIHKNRLEQIEEQNGILYDEQQRLAISSALSKGILVLTGGPGTGKTTTLNAIISLFEEAGLNISLAAPTGRAAKRMTELTGRESKTLHRLLEVDWGENDRQGFKRNEGNPLECDVIIVDELSMLDINLFEALLKAMTVNCRLIMVGDVDQLPSIGAGNVLHDLIDSKTIPVVRLKKVFRQAMESLIVTNAHKIIAGQLPEIDNKKSDFFAINEYIPRDAARLISDLYSTRLPKAYGISPVLDIQVLCPSRKRTTGTQNLNNLLQLRLNPPDKKKREWTHKGFTLREGDKVMQIRNNYDIIWTKDDGTEGDGVFNGDIGTLLTVDKYSGSLTVRFDDKTAVFTGEDVEDLELAYAITVHKSQGSEFDCVILPILDIPPQLAYRNLLYTAVTRAKKMIVVVGTKNDLLKMVNNNKRTKRYTAFSTFLSEAVK